MNRVIFGKLFCITLYEKKQKKHKKRQDAQSINTRSIHSHTQIYNIIWNYLSLNIQKWLEKQNSSFFIDSRQIFYTYFNPVITSILKRMLIGWWIKIGFSKIKGGDNFSYENTDENTLNKNP